MAYALSYRFLALAENIVLRLLLSGVLSLPSRLHIWWKGKQNAPHSCTQSAGAIIHAVASAPRSPPDLIYLLPLGNLITCE